MADTDTLRRRLLIGRTAGCIETAVAEDDLCSGHLRYVQDLVAFIDGSTPGMTFDSCRLSWERFLSSVGVTLLPLDVSGRQMDAGHIRREQVE